MDVGLCNGNLHGRQADVVLIKSRENLVNMRVSIGFPKSVYL